MSSFLKIICNILLIQVVIYSIVILVKSDLIVFIEVLIATVLFVYLFVYAYMQSRMKKKDVVS